MKTKPILFVALTCIFLLLFSGFDKSHTVSASESSPSTLSPITVDAMFIDVSCLNPPAIPLFCTAEVEYPYSDFKVGDSAWSLGPTPLNGLYQVYSGFSNVGDTFSFVNGEAVSVASPC